MSGNLQVEGFVGLGGTGSMTPNPHSVHQCAVTRQYPKAEALLTQLSLCRKPAVKPDARFPALDSDCSKATSDLLCKVLLDGMMAIPKLDGVYHCIQQSLGAGEAESGRPPFEP